MFANQYQHERFCMTIIGNFHREAFHAEQLRLARAGRARRSFVSSLFSGARQAAPQEPAIPTELLNVPSRTALMS